MSDPATSDPATSMTPAAIAAYVEQVAQLLELSLPESIRPQVVENFAQVRTIAQPVLDFELPDQMEPAPMFQP